MLNATADVCGPATFTAEFMLRSEWVDASAVAHQVIGCSIGGVICVWTLLILERIRRPSAFALAGGFTAFAGLFLAAWVVVLIKPEAQPQLWRFAQHDLVQIQHLAIASQLVLAGGSELLHARALALASATPPLLAGKWLHHLWFAHTAAVGLTFLLHPQVTAPPNPMPNPNPNPSPNISPSSSPSPSSNPSRSTNPRPNPSQRSWVAQTHHLGLGVSLILGAHLLSVEKRDGFDGASCEAVVAALCFGCATALLVHFHEGRVAPADTTPHTGTSPRCQPGYPVALGSIMAAMASAVVLLAAAVVDASPHWLRLRIQALVADDDTEDEEDRMDGVQLIARPAS